MQSREILSEAFSSLTTSKSRFCKTLTVPILLYAALDFLPGELSVFLDIAFVVATITLYTIICITTHRIVLIGDDAIPEWGIYSITMREVLFAICISGLYGGTVLLFSVIFNLPFLDDIQQLAIAFALALPVLYVVARLSLVLPSIAVDSIITLGDSWHLSRGKNFLILMILVPIIVSVAAGFVAVLFGPFREVMDSLMRATILVYEIAILSVLYRRILGLEEVS